MPAGHCGQVTRYGDVGKNCCHSARVRLRPAILQARGTHVLVRVFTVQVLPSLAATSRPELSGR